MTWEIKYTQTVAKELHQIPKKDLPKVRQALEDLAKKTNPLEGAEKLSEVTPLWRIRVGNYRIIFTLERSHKILVVLRIAHRKDAYRNL